MVTVVMIGGIIPFISFGFMMKQLAEVVGENWMKLGQR